MPIWKIILIDFLILAVVLLAFANFHHINPIISYDIENPEQLPGIADSFETPDPTGSPEPFITDEPDPIDTPTDTPTDDPTTTETPSVEPVPTGVFLAPGATPQETETSYLSENVKVVVTDEQAYSSVFHVAEIWVRDVKYLKAAFPSGRYGAKSKVAMAIAKDNNAFVATNGDQYSYRQGLVVRNGVLYREKTLNEDIAILKNDGVLETYNGRTSDRKAIVAGIKADGAWQVWTFGPMLLSDGQPMTTFNSTVTRANPRTAIGMIEPLHYLLITVEGRHGAGNVGVKMSELSQWFFDKGCKSAFNLDGGGTSIMALNGKQYGLVTSNNRGVTDIIYVGKE